MHEVHQLQAWSQDHSPFLISCRIERRKDITMSLWPFCSKNVSGQRKKARPSLERTAPFKQSTHNPLVIEGQTSGSNQALRAWEGRECSFFWSCETSHCHSLTLTAARPWPPKLPKLLKLLKLAQVALVALLRSAARI